MKRIGRREMMGTLGAATAAGLLGCTRQKRPEWGTGPSRRPPNIIFIMADDLGYGDLGCYGQTRIQTQNIDQIAREGVRFTQCYAGSTVCAPSRCALMTGKHTGHCYVRGNKRVPLPPEEVTVAGVLRDAGYKTGIIGKWGLGNPGTTGIPNRQGFEYWFGYLDQGRAHNYYPEYLWRNEEQVPLDGNVESQEHPRVSLERAQYSHDLFTDDALEFVERNRQTPFFLYLAYTIPHANNERGRFDGDGMEVPSDAPYSDRPWPQPQKSHAAMITRMDRDIGRLVTRLKELGIDRDTVLFFTSDNGPHKEGGADPAFFGSSGPLRGYKRDLYEGGIRVPMIVRWPGNIPAGTESGQVWSFWDFLPTAAELAGATTPQDIDGISMVPALLGKEQQSPEFLYWEFHERTFLQAVRNGDWKAVRENQGPLELFNLAEDVGETRNIAEDHPKVVSRIEDYLRACRSESTNWPVG